MDGAVTYRKERKEVSSPKATSIFSTSLVAAASARATYTPTLAQAPPGLAPTLGCFLLLLSPQLLSLLGAQQQPGSERSPESYLNPRAVRAQPAGRCSPGGGGQGKEQSLTLAKRRRAAGEQPPSFPTLNHCTYLGSVFSQTPPAPHLQNRICLTLATDPMILEKQSD